MNANLYKSRIAQTEDGGKAGNMNRNEQEYGTQGQCTPYEAVLHNIILEIIMRLEPLSREGRNRLPPFAWTARTLLQLAGKWISDAWQLSAITILLEMIA